MRSFRLFWLVAIALTLALVSFLVLNRLDDYFLKQQRADLANRSTNVASVRTGTLVMRREP